MFQKREKYMLFRYIGLVCVIALSVLSTLGSGGGGGGTPVEFTLLPSGFFGGNYAGSYSLTGSATNGDNFTATWDIRSQPDTTFNSKPVKTLDELLNITNTSTNATASTLINTYFSTDINNLTYEGQYSTTTGVSTMPTSTTVIPVTASIGDFGAVGDYTNSDGSSMSATWSLVDGFNGKAKFVITFTHKDSSNALYATEVHRWLISTDGSRSGVEIVITYHQSGNLTITLTGS